jgi:hypothetical protein
MKNLRLGLFLFAAALGLMPGGYCFAVVIGNFEGGSLDGWIPAPSQSYTPGLTSVVGIGNTLGQSSLAIDNSANDFWGPAVNVLGSHTTADLIGNRFLTLDATFRGIEGDVAGYGQVTTMAINDGTGYFQQHGNSAGTNNWGGSGADVTRKITFDLDQYTVGAQTYRQWLASNPAPSHITLWFVAQGGGNAAGGKERIYFDNVQLVPEPGTWALAAIGVPAVAFLVRRRRGA